MGKLNTVKMSILPKLKYKYNAIPLRLEFRNILKFIWKSECEKLTKKILREKKCSHRTQKHI